MAVAHTVGRPGALRQSSMFRPLFEYVLSNGFRHLAYVNPRNRVVLRAIVDLPSHVQQHPLEWEHLCENTTSYPRIPWPTLKHDLVPYILIAFAPEPMLRLYLERSQPYPKDGTNPLIYAAYFTKIEHSRTLLSSGVSLHRTGWHVRDPRQLLPIEVAAEGDGCHAIVDLFLKTESPVPQELFVRALGERGYLFPACNAARLLQTDEFCEWATGIRDEELFLGALDPMRYCWAFPEYRLSEEDFAVIKRRLVQINCDPYSRFNETSLRRAASAGHISAVEEILSRPELNVLLPHDIILDGSRSQSSNSAMIRLLLRGGSDVRVISPRGDTSLHGVIGSLLSEDECLESVQVLIDAGCNPSICNLAGETPLHLAIQFGYISIIKHLLSLRVQLPPNILLTVPVSHTASTIRFLVSLGGDVHAIAADGNTPLHHALHIPYRDPDECVEVVKILIDAGCSPCLPNALGATPFDIAAKHASPTVMQYLLSLNIPPPPSILLSVCHRATSGVSPMIEFLISKGADIYSTCVDGDTLLHLSTKASSEVECLRRLEILINAGCDARACNLAGETPFHVAAGRGHILVMEYLLSLGILVPLDVTHALLKLQVGPRHFYVRRYHPTIRFLINKGVDVHNVDDDGKTLLHFAAALYEEEDALAAVKFLVHSGGDPSVLNSAQETPLHVATRRGHLSVIDYFLSLDIAFPPDVLLIASSENYEPQAPVIRYLVNKGADTSAATIDGDTALHLLLKGGVELDRLESAKILIDAGCDPRARNLAGETPVHTAARSGFVTILKHFLSQCLLLPRDILRASTAATIRFLLGEGAYVFSAPLVVDDHKELMHRALDSEPSGSSEEDCLECARILVGLGWNPSLRNPSGETPMHVAARNGYISVVKYLLSQSVPLPADILFASVKPTQNPLGVHHPVELTRFFISQGASVKTTAANGDTPLHLVLRRNFHEPRINFERRSWELVEILLDSGSDPAAQNVDGQTPFDLAESQDHFFKENFLRLVRNSGVPARTLT